MPKKLIEVSLPLEAINEASVREKSIRHGHPSTLHLWWARRPLAACRAVIWASLVDDPSAHPDRFPTEEEQEKERQRLFRILERLVTWEGGFDDQVLKEARQEIMKSTDGNPPPLLDPFAGGGSIPLEAQRLGLEAHASDLNPIPVLINKALIEIPPKFAGQKPVNPDAQQQTLQSWPGATGLAEDVRYYGEWMREEAWKKIGRHYPPVTITDEVLADRPDLKKQGYKAGDELTVIAWIWARTVPSPDPAVKGKPVPLVKSFELSKKKGQEFVAVPVIDHANLTISFAISPKSGNPPEPTYVTKQGGRCIFSGTPMPLDYLRKMGLEGKMGSTLLAVVAEGTGGRVYLAPDAHQVQMAEVPEGYFKPSVAMPDNPRWFSPPGYGMKTYGDIFTPRQLTALTTFSDLIPKVHEKVKAEGGSKEKADAVVIYLGIGINRLADRSSTISSWDVGYTKIRNTFGRHALPMTWDFAEGNPFSTSTGNFFDAVNWVVKVLEKIPATSTGIVEQRDVVTLNSKTKLLVSTDPPYYDNIGYADLSDFFYIWARRSLKKIYPELFTTLTTPKADELIATPYRHDGNKKRAQEFFEKGMQEAFDRIRSFVSKDFPLTIFYAFKQLENNPNGQESETASTGWETMLAGLLASGFSIHGTWPMRTELSNRPVGIGTNALASSIVLVCRPREENAGVISRRDFLSELKQELPTSIRLLQHGNIAPVDMAQSAIGPGMAIFSKYERVLEPDGTPMPVRSALALINQVLDETLSEQEGDFDADTRWAISWYQQYTFKDGPYGVAETLSTAKNTSVSGLEHAGILKSGGGKVRLRSREDLDANWDPRADKRLTVWEATQYLTKAILEKGEEGASKLYKALGGTAEMGRELAYRLYSICEQKGWSQEAFAYNSLVIAWPAIKDRASRIREDGKQIQLDL